MLLKGFGPSFSKSHCVCIRSLPAKASLFRMTACLISSIHNGELLRGKMCHARMVKQVLQELHGQECGSNIAKARSCKSRMELTLHKALTKS